MNSMRNHVQLIGRLGADPEVKTLEKGNKVARLSMATQETFTRDGKKSRQTIWHNLVVWGRLADTCGQYLKKGREIAIEGRLTYNTWKDKQGLDHHRTEIVVYELVMFGNGNPA